MLPILSTIRHVSQERKRKLLQNNEEEGYASVLEGLAEQGDRCTLQLCEDCSHAML
jgi:hypothetical protein